MKKLYIPGIGEEETYFQVQTYMCDLEDQLIITGIVDQEIEQAVYISLTVIRSSGFILPRYIHVHFPDFNYIKCGISASLGIYYSILSDLNKTVLNYSYLITGEMDILGNVYEIGDVYRKYDVFRTSCFDFFIVPFSVKIKYEELKNDIKVIGIKNVNDYLLK